MMSLPRLLRTMLTFANDMAQWLITTQTIRIRISLLNIMNREIFDWLRYNNGYLIFQLRPIALLGYLMGALFVLMLIKKLVPLA